MDDETSITMLDVLDVYARAGTCLEARITRLRAMKQDFQAEDEASTLLSVGILGLLGEVGPQITVLDDTPRVCDA